MVKKVCGLLFSALVCTTMVFGQNKSSEKVGTSSSSPFQKGTNYLSLKMGVGTNSYFNKTTGGHNQYNKSKSPVFALVYENGITDLAGIGYVSLGLEGGYAHGKHYNNDYWASEADIYHFGVRSNYHFDFHMLTKEPFFEKFDVYAGLGFFFRFENRYATEDTNSKFDGVIQYTSNEYIFDACLGARYFLSDNFAGMIQFGSGISHFDIGGTFKF